MEYNEQKGRRLIADGDIDPGTVIIEEDPYACVILPECQHSHCHNCLKMLPLDFVPCPNCTDVKFCCDECHLISANIYHKYECGALNKLYACGLAHLALRIVMFTPFGTLKNYTCDHTEKTVDREGLFGLENDENFGTNYESVFNMVTNSRKVLPVDLQAYSKTASFLTIFLESTHFIRDFLLYISGEENCGDEVCRGCKNVHALKKSIKKLLLKHTEQLICNGHVITTLHSSRLINIDKYNEKKVASAVYPTVSLMNHSCNPNTFTSFENSKAIVRVTRKIVMGEEIFNCYGPRIGSFVKEVRQENLLQQYYFICHCSTCVSPQQEEKELASRAYKCASCSSAACTDTADGTEIGLLLSCKSCGLTEEISVREAELERLDGQELLKKFHLLEKWYHKYNRSLSEMRDAVARSLAEQGLHNDAVDLLLDNLDVISYAYGEESVEVAFLVQKIADFLLLNISDDLKKRIRPLIIEANRIFRVYYGCSRISIKDVA